MADKSQNMQDVFLNACRKDKRPVTVYLVNGVKLQGMIGGFDNFSLVLKRNQTSQLVYKHSVATVVPSGPAPIGGSEMDGETSDFLSENDANSIAFA